MTKPRYGAVFFGLSHSGGTVGYKKFSAIMRPARSRYTPGVPNPSHFGGTPRSSWPSSSITPTIHYLVLSLRFAGARSPTSAWLLTKALISAMPMTPRRAMTQGAVGSSTKNMDRYTSAANPEAKVTARTRLILSLRRLRRNTPADVAVARPRSGQSQGSASWLSPPAGDAASARCPCEY